MMLAVHATAGILIGKQLNNPFLAFILAFTSHFFLDIIPHGDSDLFDEYKDEKLKHVKEISYIIGSDLSILTGVFTITYLHNLFSLTPSIIAALIGSVLPDILVGCHEICPKIFKRFYQFHFLIHDMFDYRFSYAKGVAFQMLILAILIIIL
jgi:hypothetical protein